MANTFTRTKGTLMISDIDSDWLWSTTFPGNLQGIAVQSIHFIAHAAANICVLRDGSLTGPIVFHRNAVAVGDQVPSYFNGELIQLTLAVANGTYGANAFICIKLALKA